MRWPKHADAGSQCPTPTARASRTPNCGGKCVRAGIGHWSKLWAIHPDCYADAEGEEEAMRDFLGKDVAMLKQRTGGESRPLPLRVLRKRLEADKCDGLDMLEIGGCGCALETEE